MKKNKSFRKLRAVITNLILFVYRPPCYTKPKTYIYIIYYFFKIVNINYIKKVIGSKKGNTLILELLANRPNSFANLLLINELYILLKIYSSYGGNYGRKCGRISNIG